jgi:hypothetical protein
MATEVADIETAEGTEIEEQEEQEEGTELQTLTELTAGLDLGGGPSAVEDMPGSTAIAVAVLRQLRLLEIRLEAAREILAGLGFDFDWGKYDYFVECQAGVHELARADELVEDVRTGLFRWLRRTNLGRVIELDDRSMAAVRKLAATMPEWRARHVGQIVKAAVRHLAREANGALIVAKHFQELDLAVAEHFQELELPVEEQSVSQRPVERTNWPWVDRDGRPWDALEEKEPLAAVGQQANGHEGTTSDTDTVDDESRQGKAQVAPATA